MRIWLSRRTLDTKYAVYTHQDALKTVCTRQQPQKKQQTPATPPTKNQVAKSIEHNNNNWAYEGGRRLTAKKQAWILPICIGV